MVGRALWCFRWVLGASKFFLCAQEPSARAKRGKSASMSIEAEAPVLIGPCSRASKQAVLGIHTE